MRLLRLTMAAGILLLAGGNVSADEPPRLVQNPFSRPPSEVTAEVRPQVLADGSVQTIDLRATMVASNSRLANVGGRIMRPGDEVQGYTLLKVFEDRAIFIRQGERLTVYVKPQLEDNDV